MDSDNRNYDPELSQEDVDRAVEGRVEWLKKLKNEISEDDFFHIVAAVFLQAWHQDRQIIYLNNLIRDYEFTLGVFSSDVIKHAHASKDDLLEFMAESKMIGANMLIKGLALSKKSQGRKGGKAKDAKTGNDIKRAKIRAVWATGKYTSRDICAEQECADLDMSFSTARKALRGTPEPA